MKGRFAVIIVAACGGGLPALPEADGSTLAIKVTARESSSTALAGATGYAEYADGTNELVIADDNGMLSFASTVSQVASRRSPSVPPGASSGASFRRIFRSTTSMVCRSSYTT